MVTREVKLTGFRKLGRDVSVNLAEQPGMFVLSVIIYMYIFFNDHSGKVFLVAVPVNGLVSCDCVGKCIWLTSHGSCGMAF